MIQEYEFKDHDEWLAIRKKYIGGSDAGAVIGLNPYKSRYSLWAEKTGKISGFEGNVTTQVGAYLEDFVAKMFEDETGKKVRRKNRTMVNDLYPFACANVDRLVVGEKSLLEIKTTNSFPVMRQCRGKDFPECYYAQVVHYMAVTGLEKAYLGVLINCREFKVFELERDQAEIDALMSAEKEFWDLVEKDIAPNVDGSESTSDALAEIYPNGREDQIDLGLLQTEIQEYMGISAQIKSLTNLKDEKANIIKEYMKDAEKGTCGTYKVSFTNQSRKTFDADKLKAEHKEINIDDYYKVQSSRVFKITEKKESK